MCETQRFVQVFDKFFDCLNVRSRDAHIKRRKPNLKAYTSVNDERLKVNCVPVPLCYYYFINFIVFLTCSGWRMISLVTSRNGRIV